MVTTIEIDDKLLHSAFNLFNIKDEKQLIITALQEFVEKRSRKKKNLKNLKGKIQFSDNYNYKELRNATE